MNIYEALKDSIGCPKHEPIPLAIISEHPELARLEKNLEEVSEFNKKRYDKIMEEHREQGKKIWKEIETVLHASGKLKPGSDPELVIKAGVIFMKPDCE